MLKLLIIQLTIQLLFTLAIPDDLHSEYNEHRRYIRRSDNSIDISDRQEIESEPRNLITLQTISLVGNDGKPTTAFPLQKCQGDCDSDSDCVSPLKCYRRLAGDDITKIPGCTTNNAVELTKDASDYCYNPEDISPPKPPPTKPSSPVSSPTKRGTILYVGEDWVPRPSYPLGLCEGDCDGDFDCEGDLVCHQRQKDENGGSVPGCAGRDTTTRDYCINPSDETMTPPVNGAFLFKMFWKFGYKWQDEFWEQEWCMQCSGGSSNDCEVNDTIIVSYCSYERSTYFVYKNLKNNVAQLQIAAKSNLCLQLVGNNDIYVKVCDGTNARQKFKALNGTFGNGKFELGTVAREGCIAQQHHPKDGEIIFRMDCALTRKHTTSYWVQY